uniref:Uncharacterized protein n=1 Tax=Rhodnius prolixus TaxID=13249 RepID=T1I7N0_RHOPR
MSAFCTDAKRLALRICSNWAQPTDRQAKTLDSHALLVAALMVAKSRSRQELKFYKNMQKKCNVPFEKQKLDAVSRDTRD